MDDMQVTADRWSFKPALAALIIVTAVEFVCQLPGSVSFVLITVSLLVYAIALIAVLATSAYRFVKRRPRGAVSVLLMLLLPVLLWRPLNWAGDMAHLGLTAWFGLGQLGSSSKPKDDDFAVYDWSVGLAGANTFLIHDVTDEIALPMARHTHPASAEFGWGEDCAGKVRRLMSHYYVCYM